MADYRTPLPALLAGAMESGINHVLALDSGSLERLERLEGKALQLDLEGLGISLYFSFAYGSVEVNLDHEGPADASVSGSPAALFALAAPDEAGDWGAPGSGVRIEGDATLARDLGKLFSQLDPDWQAPLMGLFGDVAGYQLAQGLQRGATGLREGLRNALDMAGTFLNQESDVLAPQGDIDQFLGEVDDLRDGTDRLEARLVRLERQRAAAEAAPADEQDNRQDRQGSGDA